MSLARRSSLARALVSRWTNFFSFDVASCALTSRARDVAKPIEAIAMRDRLVSNPSSSAWTTHRRAKATSTTTASTKAPRATTTTTTKDLKTKKAAKEITSASIEESSKAQKANKAAKASKAVTSSASKGDVESSSAKASEEATVKRNERGEALASSTESSSMASSSMESWRGKESRAATPPPTPREWEFRTLPHASASKFALGESIASAGNVEANAANVGDDGKRTPVALSKPRVESGQEKAALAEANANGANAEAKANGANAEAKASEDDDAKRKPMALSKPSVESGGASAATGGARAGSAEPGAESRRSRWMRWLLGAVVVWIFYTATLAIRKRYENDTETKKKPTKAEEVKKSVDVKRDVAEASKPVVEPENALNTVAEAKKESVAVVVEQTVKTASNEEATKAELNEAFSAAAEFLAKVEVPEEQTPTKMVVPTLPARESLSAMDPSSDLTAASLFATAMETLGSTISEDEIAPVYRGMKLQADSDVKMFQDLAASMVQNFERVVDVERSATNELMAAIDVIESRANEATSRLELERARFVSDLERAKTAAAIEKAQALKTQESKLKSEHADFLVAERIERIKSLDDERLRVGALKTVLRKRREALERAHATQRFELAIMDLGSRLENGESFSDTISLLKACAENDPFVAAIVDSIDNSYAKEGVPTRLQLAEQLAHVRTVARRLALVPEDGAGVFAHGLAYAASLLRVKDSSDEGAQGIEGAIARAEADLAKGELVRAAEALAEASAGTKAATTVNEWARKARARAEIEQAQAALSAHATCRASAFV